MTKEEFFIKNYTDSCYGDKPLSPHWDFFQDGVEFGERKSEKKIEELERKYQELVNKLHHCWNCNKSFNKSCTFGKKLESEKKKCKDWESTFGISN